jgi:hypothetical protein
MGASVVHAAGDGGDCKASTPWIAFRAIEKELLGEAIIQKSWSTHKIESRKDLVLWRKRMRHDKRGEGNATLYSAKPSQKPSPQHAATEFQNLYWSPEWFQGLPFQ